MKVILLQDVKKVGKKGEVAERKYFSAKKAEEGINRI